MPAKPDVEHATNNNRVLAGESMWTKEGSTVVITLDKVVHTWWKNVIEVSTSWVEALVVVVL